MERDFYKNGKLDRRSPAFGYYGFTIREDRDLVDEAERAAERIYARGLSFMAGKLRAGTNNAWAVFASEAFRGEKLAELKSKGTAKAELFAKVIEKRLAYADVSAGNNYDDPKAGQLLQEIYDTVQQAKEDQLWVPANEPGQADGLYSVPPKKRARQETKASAPQSGKESFTVDLGRNFWKATRNAVEAIRHEGGDLTHSESKGFAHREFTFKGDKQSLGKMKAFLHLGLG